MKRTCFVNRFVNFLCTKIPLYRPVDCPYNPFILKNRARVMDLDWIRLRRFSLLLAAVSFSLLTALMLVGASLTTQEQPISLPHTISCTAMKVNRLASYDGPFYEDGSVREVLNVAALELHNLGQEVIPYACIRVTLEEQTYLFEATMIPPGGAVLIPEKYAQSYEAGRVRDIFGWNTTAQRSALGLITYREQGSDGIVVKNISAETLPQLALYYRTFYPEGQIYAGSRAFSVTLPKLHPGEQIHVRLPYYVCGYSRVVHCAQLCSQ